MGSGGTYDIISVLVLLVLGIALLIGPPTGHDAILPTSLERTVALSPVGNAFWTPPASSHWPSQATLNKLSGNDMESASSFSPSTSSIPASISTQTPRVETGDSLVHSHASQATVSQEMKEMNAKRAQLTKEFQMLISQEKTELSAVIRSRQLLSMKFEQTKLLAESDVVSREGSSDGEYIVDCSAPLSVPRMRPQGVMVRLIDVYTELLHHSEVLMLMSDFIKCGGEVNPSEPESGIDVLTRATSLGSLHVASLIVGHGGKLKRTLGWAATVRPDLAVGFVAAVAHQSKSVSLSMDLFRLRNVPNLDVKKIQILAQTGIHARDLLLSGPTFEKLIELIKSKEHRINSNLPRHGDKGVGTALDEFTSQLFKVLLHAGAPLQQLSYINTKNHPSNTVLHMICESYSGLILKEILNYVYSYKQRYEFFNGENRNNNNLKSKDETNEIDRDAISMYFLSDIKGLYNALRIKNHDNQSPLELSLLLHGRKENSVTRLFYQLERFCLEILTQYKVSLPISEIEEKERSELLNYVINGDNENEREKEEGAGGDGNHYNQFLQVENIKQLKRTFGSARNIHDMRYHHKHRYETGNGFDGGGWFRQNDDVQAQDLSSAEGDDEDDNDGKGYDDGDEYEVCDIDEWFFDPSVNQFKEMYIKLNRPVIIRGAVQRTNFNSYRFTKQGLLSQWSDIDLFVGEIPYAKQFEMPGFQWKLGQFVSSFDTFDASKQDQYYAFDSDPCNSWMDCDLNMLPQFVQQLSNQEFKHRDLSNTREKYSETDKPKDHVVFNPQFFLGGSETGAPFHYHFDAVNVLVFGEKEWFLTKPEDSIYSVESPAKWIDRSRKKVFSSLNRQQQVQLQLEEEQENYSLSSPLLANVSKMFNMRNHPRSHKTIPASPIEELKDQEENEENEEKDLQYMSKVMRCTQHSGDVMLVPKMWGHLTYNTQSSIGVAFELKL